MSNQEAVTDKASRAQCGGLIVSLCLAAIEAGCWPVGVHVAAGGQCDVVEPVAGRLPTSSSGKLGPTLAPSAPSRAMADSFSADEDCCSQAMCAPVLLSPATCCAS